MELERVVKEFSVHLEISGYAPATLSSYNENLLCFIEYLKSKNITSFKQVTHKVIREYFLYVKTLEISEITKAMRISPVKKVFKWLVESRKLLIDPTENLKVNHPSRRKLPPVLTINEIKNLLEQPNLELPVQFRDRVIMEVLYSSGMRINELINLKLPQINLKEREIIILEGKGGHQRIVPIGKRAASLLHEYITTIRSKVSKKNPDEKHLFLTDKGNPVTGNTVRTAFFRYKKTAKITKPASPHSFRRCFATHMLQHGADIRHIQQLLGHQNLKTTQIYARVYPVDLKVIHEKTHTML